MEASPRSQASTNNPAQSGSSLPLRHAVNGNFTLGCQLHAGPSTQRCLKVPEGPLQPGRKRSGTHVIHDQQLAKRSRENLRGEEVQASTTEAQLPHIEQQTDSEEEPEEARNVKAQLKEWRAKKDYKMLEGRRHYVEKSIGCRVAGMSETVKNGLATLPKLESEVLGGGLEGELRSLGSIPVETDEERSNRVNDWVKAARTYFRP